MKTIDQIRREKLALLIAEAGGAAALAHKIGKNPAQISQWLNASKESKTGRPRGMRSETCRTLEDACKKPFGWMDREGDTLLTTNHKEDLQRMAELITLYSQTEPTLRPRIFVAVRDLIIDLGGLDFSDGTAANNQGK